MAQGETFSVTCRAMRELRDVVVSTGGDVAWNDVVGAVPAATRAACAQQDESAWIEERHWVDVLHAADARFEDDGAIARGVGAARAHAIEQDLAVYAGDPIRFLKLGASLWFKDRANYGATLLELAPKKAIVRVLASPHVTLKRAERPNKVPLAIAAFLETITTQLAGAPQPCRYAGATQRADNRFGQPVYNQVFEFDLEDDARDRPSR